MKRKRWVAAGLAGLFLLQSAAVGAAELPDTASEEAIAGSEGEILKAPEEGYLVNEAAQPSGEAAPAQNRLSVQSEGQTGNAVLLSAETIQYDSYYDKSAQIPCESRGGIYFLNDRELVFYQLDTKETVPVYTFDYYADCYVTDSKLYVLDYDSQILVYDLESQSVERTISSPVTASVIGVDAQGRIYLAGQADEGYLIYLLSPSGEELSRTVSENTIYNFSGFDSSNGNFYVESYENWVYWGYNHDMHAVRAGNVTENAISFNEIILMYACQAYWYERQGQVCMLGDKYLSVDSTFQSYLTLWDSNSFDTSAPVVTEIFRLSRDNTSQGFDSLASVGVRAVYREDTDSIVAYKDDLSITEYDIASGTEIVSYRTDYPVFALLEYGEDILAIERSGDQFYYERIEWKKATEVQIHGEASVVKAGETLQLTAETDGTLAENFRWSTDDPKIASINQDGVVFGWREGTAVISVETESGLTAQYTVAVTAGDFSEEEGDTAVNTNGESSWNHSSNNYAVWSTPVSSYLVPDQDGNYVRIENSDGRIIAETFSPSGTRIGTHTVEPELDRFGGFYSGDSYYYFVFGQYNAEENDETEVVRVVRYSKDFERIDELSIYGANTYAPFEAGSLRMAETEENLYIYTCHKMYTADDGLNHQANMTFVIDKESMSLTDSYYDVMNIAQAGYVSHSFNQFIQTDGEYVFRVDHGDAYPRGISITRCRTDGSVTDVIYTVPLSFGGSIGDNTTGASVGGFELSEEHCVIAGNSIDQSQGTISGYGQRNIFVSITDQDLQQSSVVWLTDYDGTENISVYTPHLVKIGSSQFLVMWEEIRGGSMVTCMVTMDDEGHVTSDTVQTQLPLSDCAPIFCEDGFVRWYTTQGGSPILYAVNPFNLEAVEMITLPFTDVDPVSGNWFYDEVANVYKKQLMTGKSETIFAPYEPLARAQFAVVLHRLEGEKEMPYTEKFPDIADNVWYTDAILWAADEGIVTGYEDTGLFGPADNINREQMAVMMYRYAQMKGYDVSIKADYSGYLDASSVNAFASEAMKWAVGCGIITGKYDNTILDPQGNASRAECAIILTRFTDYYGI